MQKIIFGLLTFIFLFSLAGPAAQAQHDAAEEIRQMLEERDEEIKAILGDKDELTADERDRLRKVVNDNIDFRAMGRTALGPYWTEITESQQEEFLTTFTKIIREQSLSNIKIYRAKVTYEDITVEGDSAHVTTITQYDDVVTPVEYDLHRENGVWKVIDITIDGVSTADSYARSFQTVIRKRGFDALMTSLEKKLAELEKSA